jgi:DNA-binding SARP family transcriptional activator
VDAFLGILGTTALLLDGEADDNWGKPKERAVLATLAVHVGQVVTIDTLIRWAWPADTPIPQYPAPTFHTYATRIRKALRRLPTPANLRAGQGGYRLEMDKSLIDRFRFRELVTQGRAHADAHEPSQAIERIEEALALWRGAPVADLTSAAALAWRATVVQNDLLVANTTLIEQLVTMRRHDAAISRLDDLHADHPDDVTLAVLRLTALYGGRRSTHATAFYLAAYRKLQNNGDDQAAAHLRQRYEELRAEHEVAHRPTPAAVPHQLPHDHAFVGRTELLDMLDTVTNAATDEPTTGVVLIDGTGGVGKTALAVHWAHRHRHLFPDGELFVKMHGYADRAQVEHATVVDRFLVALGQSPDPKLPPSGREQLLSSLLANRKTVVVLDNVRDTAHIRELVPLLSSSLVLITSRQWLTSLRTEAGARRVLVRPMSVEEGTTLMSAQLGPRSRLDEEQRTALAELCGGLPLLITVVAEYLASRPADRIAEYSELLDRRRLVVGLGDHGDGPTGGAACFEPSYRALAARERRLFRLLTLHPGPDIGLDAACACDGRSAEETFESITKLAGAHLIEAADAVDRYRFHDVVAEYAAHCRDRDEPKAEQVVATHRVLDYYVGSATHACRAVHRSYNAPPLLPPQPGVRMTAFPDADSARQWFDRERTTLDAAIMHAAEHEYHEHVWRLADPLTTFYDRGGYNLDSRKVREIAVRATRAVGNREAEASTLSGLGMVHMTLGDYPQAKRCLEAALLLVAKDGPARGHGSVLHQLGRVALRQGDTAAALALFRRGMAIAQDNGDQEGMCWAHCRIGHALHTIDRHQDALRHLRRACLLAQQIGEASAEASSLSEIGAIHRELGDLTTATAHCEQALAVAAAVPDLAATARICVVLCEINRVRHRSRQAIGYGRRAVEVCEKTHDLAAKAQALDVLGAAQYECGDLPDAVVAWRQAAELYDHTGNAAHAARLHGRIEGVPIFHQESVPLGRSADQAREPSWPRDDEVTRPLDAPQTPMDDSGSTY